MRIEVAIEGQEPTVHRLNKEKTLLGSSAECDVVVDAEGISRKHLIIVAQEDQFYVLDQGSKNGTFINEDRLVPGQRAEFTSFFPVRLGGLVVVSLLSDEEQGDRSFDFGQALAASGAPAAREKTAPDLPTPPSASGTSPGVTRTQMLRPERPFSSTPPSRRERAADQGKVARPHDPDAARMRRTKILAALVVVVGSALFFYTRPVEEPVVESVAPVAQVETRKMALNEGVFTFPASPTLEEAQALATQPRCVQEGEKSLCGKLGLPHSTVAGTGLSLAAGKALLVLPALGEDVWAQHSVALTLMESAKANWTAQPDFRDVVALALLRSSAADLAALAKGARWLMAAPASPGGAAPTEYYLVDLQALASQVNDQILQSLASKVSQGGLESLAPLAGMWRQLE